MPMLSTYSNIDIKQRNFIESVFFVFHEIWETHGCLATWKGKDNDENNNIEHKYFNTTFKNNTIEHKYSNTAFEY